MMITSGEIFTLTLISTKNKEDEMNRLEDQLQEEHFKRKERARELESMNEKVNDLMDIMADKDRDNLDDPIFSKLCDIEMGIMEILNKYN